MSENIITYLKIGLSGMVGGVFCVFADICFKGRSGAIFAFANNIQVFINTETLIYPSLVTALLIVVLAICICFIFDVDTKKKAFTYGASVLAIAMTFVPIKDVPGVATGPNSVQVNVNLITSDNRSVTDVTLTLKDAQSKRIVARSKFSRQEFTFYAESGRYFMYIEVPGYSIETLQLDLQEGMPAQSFDINLKPSKIPGLILMFKQ